LLALPSDQTQRYFDFFYIFDQLAFETSALLHLHQYLNTKCFDSNYCQLADGRYFLWVSFGKKIEKKY
jgi:hypothetical protein